VSPPPGDQTRPRPKDDIWSVACSLCTAPPICFLDLSFLTASIGSFLKHLLHCQMLQEFPCNRLPANVCPWWKMSQFLLIWFADVFFSGQILVPFLLILNSFSTWIITRFVSLTQQHFLHELIFFRKMRSVAKVLRRSHPFASHSPRIYPQAAAISRQVFHPSCSRSSHIFANTALRLIVIRKETILCIFTSAICLPWNVSTETYDIQSQYSPRKIKRRPAKQTSEMFCLVAIWHQDGCSSKA